MSSTPVRFVEKFSSQDLAGHQWLDLRAISPKAWETIVQSCTASEVSLYYLKIVSLAGVERLHSTSRLSIEYANKIEDVSPLFKMTWLTKLFLSDLPRIRRIDGIEALQGIRELRLSGNRGSLTPPLRLSSVQSLANLRKLENLEITNIRLDDRDISFMATSFPNLRALRLSGKEFEREQLAYLARKLNPQLEKPLLLNWEMKSVPCRKCKRNLHFFMGRGMPMLCPFDDEKKFKKLTEESPPEASSPATELGLPR